MLAIYTAALDSDVERSIISEIYEKHKQIMLYRALKITKNAEIAEDAVHNAFEEVIKRKEKYLLLSNKELRALLVVITKNKCIDLLRKNNALNDEWIDDMDESVIPVGIPIEEQIILSEEYETIRKHVASLDEQSRLVLEMKYILEMTYKEIGEALGMTAKHVDTKIMRAKEKVRKLIALGGAV